MVLRPDRVSSREMGLNAQHFIPLVIQGLAHVFLQFSGKCLVQQRLLQRIQRGELALIDGGEALGFFCQGVEFSDDGILCRK